MKNIRKIVLTHQKGSRYLYTVSFAINAALLAIVSEWTLFYISLSATAVHLIIALKSKTI